MKLENYEYHVLKYVNKKAGLTFYVLENDQACCRITMMDENTEKNERRTHFLRIEEVSDERMGA